MMSFQAGERRRGKQVSTMIPTFFVSPYGGGGGGGGAAGAGPTRREREIRSPLRGALRTNPERGVRTNNGAPVSPILDAL